MAVYNELQVGRYVRFLQKFFGIKGRQPAPLTFTGEIGAFIPLFHGAENKYLEGWNRFAGSFVFAAVVAAGNGQQLRNPSGSNIIAVFEKILLTSQSVSCQVNISEGTTGADLPNPGTLTNARLDPRGNPQPSLISSQQQAGAVADLANLLASTIFIGNAAGLLPQFDYILTDDQEIPLLPGEAIRIRTSSVNIPSVFTLMWRERVLEESELK